MRHMAWLQRRLAHLCLDIASSKVVLGLVQQFTHVHAQVRFRKKGGPIRPSPNTSQSREDG